jgi:ATP/ADP translocase
MKNPLNFEKKTWSGLRWLFVILAVIFGLICVHLINQNTQESFISLLIIPALFIFCFIGLALFASDEVLDKAISLFPMGGF